MAFTKKGYTGLHFAASRFYDSGQMSAASHMSDTLTFSKARTLTAVFVHFSVVHTSTEYVAVRVQNVNGSAYDMVLFSWSAQGEKDYFWQPSSPIIMQSGDAILFSCRMSGAANVYGINVDTWAVLEG